MSKYFSVEQLQEALKKLRPHHPIFATTFWVMKQGELPIGNKIRFRLDAHNDEFLTQQYRIHPNSNSFFRVFRQGTQKKDWNKPDYAGKGLQSVNTRGLPKAFLHDRNGIGWGWSEDYLNVLREKLPQGNKIPLFCIAAWFYKDRPFSEKDSRARIVRQFISDFNLSPIELDNLFETEVESKLSESEAFDEVPYKPHQLLSNFSTPPDAPPEEGGLLNFLEVNGVGPAVNFKFEPSERLNIITGDNGLGKTFILDLAWWALTQDWIERPAQPLSYYAGAASIKYIVGKNRKKPDSVNFSREEGKWIHGENSAAISGLVVYARVDGSFAIHDPAAKNSTWGTGNNSGGILKLSKRGVIEGNQFTEGLIRDWVKWQERRGKNQIFSTFERVLSKLFPPDIGSITIGEPVRLLGERREIPTLVHSYDTVPFVFESAGIQRIVALAYVIVWAWEEHKIQVTQKGLPPEKQMVILLDEAEAHLHPKWQRIILPAIMDIASSLGADISVQLIIATHSPLILASSETVFNRDQDKLFHLDISPNGVISLKDAPFNARGTIDSWLSSSIFNLKEPGSAAREAAIRNAVALQKKERPKLRDLQEAHERLKETLEAEDPFWTRWLFFAELKGVKV